MKNTVKKVSVKEGVIVGTRLGLDIGTNSIGWALLELKEGRPVGLVRTGVRIFPSGRNPKDNASLAVNRREARQARKMRDRKLKRQTRLMETLVDTGLMPSSETERKQLESIDPYEIRSIALSELVDPSHLGRALFHLAKRRGFKSNRKQDASSDESGLIKSSITATREQMHKDGAETYGAWLHQRRIRGEGVLARTSGTGKDKRYEVYSDRALTEEEIDLLFERQRTFGSTTCSESTQKRIKEIVLFQRDLLPVTQGSCTFERDELRAALALQKVQEFRIYQELNNLRIINQNYVSRALSLDERDALASELSKRPKLTLEQIHKKLRLGEKDKINFEASRTFLVGNQTNCALANKKILGQRWFDLSGKTREIIVELLIHSKTDAVLHDGLTELIELTEEECTRLLAVHLVEGYSRLSEKAINKILIHLKSGVHTYDKAAALAGYNHSDQYTGEWFATLPYYGQILHQYTGVPQPSSNEDEATYGRIANPTVHIALNQIRKVVNGIIEHYGHPDEIHVEVVRDLKMGQKAKKELEKTQRENEKLNTRHRERLAEIGQRDTYDNRLRLRLWEELNEDPMNRRCPFSGDRIGIERLFTPDVQIEHLIPFADCLDDSQANKTLSTRKANADKGKNTPFEAFGSDQGGYCWEDILDRADLLPKNKQRRFSADARQLFTGGDWLARQLNDTAYISRVTKKYLTAICNPNNVRVTPGRLTALFRRALDLDTVLGTSGKNRTDHRHHAIDAIVVGLTEASLIRAASNHAANDALEKLSDRLKKLDAPWQAFRSDVEASMERLAVSHKPDHGTQSALHNETAYGLIELVDGGASLVRHRKEIASITESDLLKISDSRLMNEITQFIKASGAPFKEAVALFSNQNRAQKCTLEERMSVIPIHNADGEPYKAYKGDGNYCYEIFWENSKKWSGRLISNFEANQRPYKEFRHDLKSLKQSIGGEPLIMRICSDDIIATGQSDERVFWRVVKMSANKIIMAPISEADVDARNREAADPFKFLSKSPSKLQELKARRVFIDEIGNVKDPGPPSCPPGF